MKTFGCRTTRTERMSPRRGISPTGRATTLSLQTCPRTATGVPISLGTGSHCGRKESWSPQNFSLHLTELYPATNTGQVVNVVSLHDDIAGPVRPALLVLMFAVGLILLIVCANVANLLLARTSLRRREIAMRLALGAGRSRIARQLLTESVLLALLGCASGLLLARWCVAGLKLLAASILPRAQEFSLNGPALIFSVALSICAGIVFGVGPALQAARGSVHETLKSGTRESPTGSRFRMRSLLVILETALGVVFL